jgi:hypothetical protein
MGLAHEERIPAGEPVHPFGLGRADGPAGHRR